MKIVARIGNLRYNVHLHALADQTKTQELAPWEGGVPGKSAILGRLPAVNVPVHCPAV